MDTLPTPDQLAQGFPEDSDVWSHSHDATDAAIQPSDTRRSEGDW